MTEDEDMKQQGLSDTQKLVMVGVPLAQILNDHLFKVEAIKKWPTSRIALGIICLAAGLAKAENMPEEDFQKLCMTAFRSIEGKRKSLIDLPFGDPR